MGNDGKNRIHYCVLFTQTLKQWDVTESLKRALPEGRGTVFYPCVELWMGSLGQTVVEPLFPGYVFIRSDMGRYQLHDFIRDRRREVLAFIKELHISERRVAGDEGEDDAISDLNDEEAELLDFMLGFCREDKAGAHSPEAGEGDAEQQILKAGESEATAGLTDKGKRIWRRKLPESGVLGMSYGYKDKNGGIVVMEGPLKGHENRIVDVNVRDRRAYLDLRVGGRMARAGLTIKGKKYWYPNDKASPDVLGDGTAVNCRDIAAAMMGCKKEGSQNGDVSGR